MELVGFSPDSLVSVELLRSVLDPGGRSSHGLVIADVRWKPEASVRDAFEAGHVPGAVSIDVDTDLSAPAFEGPGRHPLPSPEAFARSMGEAGIGDEAAVVAYDDVGGSVAARLWWMLHVTGHRAALLDLPSLDAWTGAGEALETGPAAAKESATFTAGPWPAARTAAAHDVRVALIDGTAVVVDARAEERYRGEIEPIDPVAGHIPGAVSAPWIGNSDPVSGSFLSAEALAERYRSFGVTDGTDVIASCGSGVTACLAVFALERAGLGGARLYEGSWSDWTHDPSRPVAIGSDPGVMR